MSFREKISKKTIINHFNLNDCIDAHISSEKVKYGRPYPYMIYHCMENTDILSINRVAKAGDSARDIEEGKNAGCGLVIGVLSGADNEEELFKAGADIVVDVITDLYPINLK